MNKEDILKLVQESYEQGQSDLMKSCEEAVVKAIEVAIAAEREACAGICDRFQMRDVGMQPAECAGAIRARGETK